MKTIYMKLLSLAVLVVALSSCLKDLDTQPIDNNQLTVEQLYKDPSNYKGILAKCYGSLILTGQQGGDGGNNDLGAFNEGYGGYVRILFYLQTLATDEVLMPSSTNGLRDCATNGWTANTAVIQGAYNRLYHTIGYANEFLRQTTDAKLHERGVYDAPEIKNNIADYRNEARFIRAYCYQVLCDLFGSVPFATDEHQVGYLPKQKTRVEIYDYVVSELLDLENKLKEPKTNEYARVDKAAVWFLLARTYINAEVYTGTARYSEALTYSKKVLTSGYPLAPTYIENFLADNDQSTEIIWPLAMDGKHAQSSAGTNFFVKAFCNGDMNDDYETGVGTKGWGNVRVRPEFVDKFDVADQTFKKDDAFGLTKQDKRAQFYDKGHNKSLSTADGKISSNFTDGYAFIKWRNVRKDGQPASDGTYVDIDFPLFRTADAYLMAAEAILRGAAGGSRSDALGYVNEVRNRAYQSGSYGSDASGEISDAQLSLDFMIDERAREMSTELVRRSDLIRFGKYTTGYNWQWKGYTEAGKDIDAKYMLFPIPASDIGANPNLVQNPNFK